MPNILSVTVTDQDHDIDSLKLVNKLWQWMELFYLPVLRSTVNKNIAKKQIIE